ncbi:GMC oxidoreductase [Limimaricola hongkongensis]|uniref:Glucose-methanol-choline (GMC) oxidoreductase:NAD binding site n=1 Tax=Limimaricola hongkongensis DSM 17492 TaxID=1122180 RepID=A0A017H9E6_9RHOB|nr:GMC family oxidoreductase [Limimaricola hongkongensis]EYD70414.1 Glucose-methanol-choline (GMC) oxidoreductase:NAD binding site [Limimaricola hongkongensis DSM 17492]
MNLADPPCREASLDEVRAGTGYDAVVIGGGATGGLAAEQLTEAGRRVLLLDAGYRKPLGEAPVGRIVSGFTRLAARPALQRALPYRALVLGQKVLRGAARFRQPVQSQCYAWPSAPDAFVDDIDNPYETPPRQPYRWVRVRQLGGRMIVPAHGKQYYRHSEVDFSPPDAPGWPVDYDEIAPWYDLVERKLGLSGRRESSRWIPDSRIETTIAPNPLQSILLDRLAERYPSYTPILGRHALPRPSVEIAARTGLLGLRKGAVVRSLQLTEAGAVAGVNFVDARSGAEIFAPASAVFLCASAFESTRILMNSSAERHSTRFPAPSPALGRYITDHISAKIEGTLRDRRVAGVRIRTEPEHCICLPRFDTRTAAQGVSSGGFGLRMYLFGGGRGTCHFVAVSDAELEPRDTNRLVLSERRDRWNIPALRIDCRHGARDAAVFGQQVEALRELVELFDIETDISDLAPSVPGASIHECGGARMGTDPSASVLDARNRPWGVKGLYVTDGAAFPAIGIQNPTLTMMALTARACDFHIRATA